MRRLKSKIALMLLVTVIMNSLPTNVWAASRTINSKISENQQEIEEDSQESKIIQEIEEKRDGNTKHFLKEDKSYEAVVYPIQVHYMEGGVWKEIDNTLEEAKDATFVETNEEKTANENVQQENSVDKKTTEDNTNLAILSKEENESKLENKVKEPETENVVTNKNNNFDISFSKNTKSNKLVTIAKDNYKLSWGIADIKESTAEVSAIDENKLHNQIKEEVYKKVDEGEEYKNLSAEEKSEVKEVLTENEKIKAVSKTYSAVEFNDIYDGIDLTYDIIGDVVKENFIIKEKKDDVKIKVRLNAENMVPVLQSDKTIIFYDKNDQSKAVYKIAAPIMYDDNNEFSSDIDLSLHQTADGCYDLNIIPSSEWLNDDNRVYPVKLDPTVETSLGIKDIQDTFVCSLDSENKRKNILVRIGNGDNMGIMRGYFKFTLPTLNTTDMVTSAKVNFYEDSAYNGGAQINLHKVLSDWNSSTINWGNKPAYDQKIDDYDIINTSNHGWHDFDITAITKEWYEKGNNYGLMLKAENEGGGRVAFRSSDTTVTEARPSVSIAYCSNLGLESYWTYHTQEFDRAGTGYVNDYNGSLTFVHNDISMTGNRMPITLKHIYNLKDGVNGYDWGFGLGWRLSLQQTVEEKTINNVKYFVYTDEDGTVHYFKVDGNNAVKDTDGLSLTINKNADGSYTIKDKNDGQMIFGADGFLREIKDSNNNHIVITYRDTPRSKDINTITDGAGRVVTLNYDQEQRLASITEPDGSIAASYSYEGGALKKITYKDGNVSTYNYDGSKLKEVIDCTGYKINYEFTSSNPIKVKSVKESTTSGETGGILNIEYGNNTTTFRDMVNWKTDVYSFNNLGNTISVRDNNGNAKYYKYSTIGNVGNKLTTESKIQSTIINLAANPSMEDDRVYNSDANGVGKVEKSNDAYLGNKSMKISKKDNKIETYFEQYVSLDKGETYTFSAYMKTKSISDTHNGKLGARIVAFVQDNEGNYIPYGSEFIQGDNDWERYSTTFTVPWNSVSDKVIIRAVIDGESGEAYVDNFQLEKGKVANRFNLIENGDFSGQGTEPSGWINVSCDGSCGVTSAADLTRTSKLSYDVYKITGSAGSGNRKIQQHVNMSGKKGDVFSIGAWAKAAAVQRGKFAIEAVFNGASSQMETFRFNSDCMDWQYLSEYMITKNDYTSIDVYLIYENNVNTAYFDGVQLYKETYGSSYQYDLDGNIVSSVDLANKNTKYEYDGNNNLVNLVKPNGSNFKYEYDTNKNIIRSVSSEGLVNTFQYDQYGNPVESMIGSGDTYLRASSSYTENGNYVKSVTNSLGAVTTYDYNETTGNLNSVTDAEGNKTNYSYDSMDRVTEVSKKVGESASSNKYTYANDKISQIQTNGTSYSFAYNAFGDNTSVSVGSQELSRSEYENGTGILLKTTYGNGDAISRDYDGYGRNVAGKVYGDSKTDIQCSSYLPGYGWQEAVSNKGKCGNNNKDSIVDGIKISLKNAPEGMSIKYQVHVAEKCWLDWKSDGEAAGTVGENLRIEAIRIRLEGAPKGYRVRYRAHVEDIGWQEWVQDGETAGTTGLAKRINEIQVDVDKVRYENQYDANSNLAVKNDYVNDIQYKYTYDFANRLVRLSDSNGNVTKYTYDENNKSSAVSKKINGKSYETNCNYDKDGKETSLNVKNNNKEFKVNNSYDSLGRTTEKTIENGTNKYKTSYKYEGSSKLDDELTYDSHVAEKCWLGEVKAGEISGTTGESRRMEAFKINLKSSIPGMTIKYQAHVAEKCWLDWVGNGEVAGTTGESRRLEAVRIKLEGAPEGYHIKYQVHAEDYGWMPIVQDGEIAGTTGQSRRIEAIRIFLVKDGASESTQISSITNGNDEIYYTYNKNGKIETITDEDGKKIRYNYDELGQVVREDNEVLNKTIVNSYDLGGNILSRSEYALTNGEINGQAVKTISYAYNDSNWKDKLTSFDGKEIIYDKIGNPLSFDGWNFSWSVGRDLMSMSKGDTNISYKYDEAGVRTEKTVNGVTTKYILSGNDVIYESNEDDEIYYTYDSNGKLVSINLNNDEYFYVKNVQNDIIALVDNDGNKVVEYTYDTLGKVISIEGELKDSLGVKNPYRYRSYRYDNETKLYYLQTRYYNPEIGRFINADSLIGEEGEILKHNIFAYCANDFVNSYDDNGEEAITLGIAALFGITMLCLTGGYYASLQARNRPMVPMFTSTYSERRALEESRTTTAANTANRSNGATYRIAVRRMRGSGGIYLGPKVKYDTAKYFAQNGVNIYTYYESDAKQLAIAASQNSDEIELHRPHTKRGRYPDNKWHYHLDVHNQHIFFDNRDVGDSPAY